MIDFNEVLDQYRSAARTAFKEVGDAAGVPLLDRQEHLQALRNMSVEDLDVLSQEFGVDQVARYISNLAGG